jgi:AraC-like DNA-binding protein
VLANLAGVSPRQLSRILSGGGYTLPVLLLELRLELAMRVLLSERGQQMKISDVATYCGFSSLPHFSRAFRAHYGFSPSSVDARQDAQLRKFA